MDTILLTGLFAAFFTTFAFAPQSIKTIRTRNTEGISVVMYIMFLTGVISWIAYGIMRSDFAVLIDAPRDKCALSCAINGIHAAFHYLKKNYISGSVMTVPTG